MGFLFDSGSDTQTVVNDPWKTMPDWMKEQFKKDGKFRQDLLREAKAEAGQPPADILGQDPFEYGGLEAGLEGLDRADGITSNRMMDRLGRGTTALGEAEDQFGVADKQLGRSEANLGRANKAVTQGRGQLRTAGGELDDLSGVGRSITRLAGDVGTLGDIDLDQLQKRYTSKYTDDVVDTTLSGMSRQAERERLAREAQGAALGGTSNTRTAVGNAVADQLTGLNMSQREAELRDRAHEAGFDNALDAAGFASDRVMNAGDLRGAGGTFDLERAKGYESLGDAWGGMSDASSAIADRWGDIAGAREGIGNSWAGLSGDYGDLAEGYGGISDRMSTTGMARAGLLGTFGETRRGLDQQAADQEANWRRDNIGWLGNIFTGTNVSKGPIGSEQSTTTPTASPFQQILGTAATAAGAFMQSDERVKEDVEVMEGGLEAMSKLKPSSYRYKKGYGHVEGRTAGLMAQDVERAIPEAVREIDGVKSVDPYPVLATVVRAVQELDARTRTR